MKRELKLLILIVVGIIVGISDLPADILGTNFNHEGMESPEANITYPAKFCSCKLEYRRDENLNMSDLRSTTPFSPFLLGYLNQGNCIWFWLLS